MPGLSRYVTSYQQQVVVRVQLGRDFTHDASIVAERTFLMLRV